MNFRFFFLLLVIVSRVFGEQGIVVSGFDGYMRYLLPSIAHLRENLHCTLPIEVWHSGDELSQSSKRSLARFGNIVFRDIAQELKVHPNVYRGWHIKPWIIHLSSFDEVILMDADAYFCEDPRILFSHPGYIETGAFFFRDRGCWYFPLNSGNAGLDKSHSVEFYLGRRQFIRSLIPSHSPWLPSDWEFFWKDELPTAEKPFLAIYQESGCLAIDKKRHPRAIQNILQLNEDRNNTYRYVYGDKETYWMGFEMSQEPYYVNRNLAYSLRSKAAEIYMVHVLDDGRLFFFQKNPENIDETAIFWDKSPEREFRRPVREDERRKILQAYQMRLKFQ